MAMLECYQGMILQSLIGAVDNPFVYTVGHRLKLESLVFSKADAARLGVSFNHALV